MREIKFKLVFKDSKSDIIIISDTYELSAYNGFEAVLEDLEEKYGCDGNCTDESVNHCECGTLFDDYILIDKIMGIGEKDSNDKEIFQGDICEYNQRIVIDKGKQGYIKNIFVIDGILAVWRAHCLSTNNNITIVGNIHENKDMIP